MRANTYRLLPFFLLPLAAQAGFMDPFTGAIDPSWQVFTSSNPAPTNHTSLTANPGNLRYSLDPLTDSHGFELNMQSSGGSSSGLDLRHAVNGTGWTIETKADYFLPVSNGRHFAMSVYFGDGSDGTYRLAVRRGRDVNQNYLDFYVGLHSGGIAFQNRVTQAALDFDLAGPDNTQFYERLSRDGNTLRGQYSTDGFNWITALTYDVPTGALDGLNQTLSLTGGSFVSPAGSYADYDYISIVDNVPEPSALSLALGGLLWICWRKTRA